MTDSPNVPPPSTDSLDARNKRMGKMLIGVIVGMFLLAFASIPLYRWVCAQVAPGGSAYFNGEADDYTGVTVDSSRTVRVRFAANVERQLPWDFYPEASQVTVHPGEKKLIKFVSRNKDTVHAIKGKAVYDINPPEAHQYFKKIECFCFIEQTLEAGERVDMPLYFWFDPAMPAHIKDVTLAYTFFNADSSMARSIKNRQAQD